MTEQRRRPRRPGSAPVIWASTLLFAALFAVLTYNLSVAGSAAQTAPAPLVRKVIKRRIVTTIVPTPGENTVSTGPASYSSTGSAPVTTSAS